MAIGRAGMPFPGLPSPSPAVVGGTEQGVVCKARRQRELPPSPLRAALHRAGISPGDFIARTQCARTVMASSCRIYRLNVRNIALRDAQRDISDFFATQP
jgi:hypothetical protein